MDNNWKYISASLCYWCISFYIMHLANSPSNGRVPFFCSGFVNVITCIQYPCDDSGIKFRSVSFHYIAAIHHGDPSHRDVVLDGNLLANKLPFCGPFDISLVIPTKILLYRLNTLICFCLLNVSWLKGKLIFKDTFDVLFFYCTNLS